MINKKILSEKCEIVLTNKRQRAMVISTTTKNQLSDEKA